MSLADPAPLQPFLHRLLSRSELSTAERQAILDLPFTPAQIAVNRDFVRLRERAEEAFFIVEGLVGRFGQNREGIRQTTAIYLPGDMVGLRSIAGAETNTALQALAVTTVLRVPHVALRNAARSFPALAEAFWRECVVDAAILAEWIISIGRRDARARLAHLFCEVACRAGRSVPASGARFPFPATQVHIGEMTGLTSVHVNRSLQGLRRDGLVDLRERQIHLLDWDRLAAVGDFSPEYLSLECGDRIWSR